MLKHIRQHLFARHLGSVSSRNDKSIIVIPARYDSSRFPGSRLVEFQYFFWPSHVHHTKIFQVRKTAGFYSRYSHGRAHDVQVIRFNCIFELLSYFLILRKLSPMNNPCARARKARSADAILVATDHPDIAAEVRRHGGTAIITGRICE